MSSSASMPLLPLIADPSPSTATNLTEPKTDADQINKQVRWKDQQRRDGDSDTSTEKKCDVIPAAVPEQQPAQARPFLPLSILKPSSRSTSPDPALSASPSTSAQRSPVIPPRRLARRYSRSLQLASRRSSIPPSHHYQCANSHSSSSCLKGIPAAVSSPAGRSPAIRHLQHEMRRAEMKIEKAAKLEYELLSRALKLRMYRKDMTQRYEHILSRMHVMHSVVASREEDETSTVHVDVVPTAETNTTLSRSDGESSDGSTTDEARDTPSPY